MILDNLETEHSRDDTVTRTPRQKNCRKGTSFIYLNEVIRIQNGKLKYIRLCDKIKKEVYLLDAAKCLEVSYKPESHHRNTMVIFSFHHVKEHGGLIESSEAIFD